MKNKEIKSKSYKFVFKFITPYMYDKFPGQGIEFQNDKEEKEKTAYRCQNGNLGIPLTSQLHGMCLYYISRIKYDAKKGKLEAFKKAPYFAFQPYLFDTGLKAFQDTFEATVINPGKLTYRKVRGLLTNCEVPCTVITSLLEEEVKEYIEEGLSKVGIGGNRRHGFGRGELISWEKI